MYNVYKPLNYTTYKDVYVGTSLGIQWITFLKKTIIREINSIKLKTCIFITH